MSNQRRNRPNRKGNSGKPAGQKKTVSNPNEMRLNKYIANSGICSRRDADMHIQIGSVTVNGQVITEMGYKVKMTDEVRFDGARISPEKPHYILLNKPKGFLVTTKQDESKSVFDLVKNAVGDKTIPVGKLEKQGMGLLLLTNDGDLSKKLNSNNHKIRVIYQVSLDKPLKGEHLDSIKEGINIKGKKVSVIDISYIDDKPQTEIGIHVYTAKGELVHQIFDHFDYKIQLLDRVSYGGLTKKDLPRGKYRALTDQEVNNLRML
ncbi:pseudouridine synthase [Spongiivirga sp. MCCC 1A20706]|uniref:pseudouridine synthase n=1 Tax=Spongiivirga sp. MCCC 1A20706 TaxID=3160963 RepID=UPI00397763AC